MSGLLRWPTGAITERITMTKSASTSHDDAVARELRDDPLLAAEYLRAAIADSDESSWCRTPAVVEARATGSAIQTMCATDLDAAPGDYAA